MVRSGLVRVPELLFVTGAVSQYLGAAVAVVLFSRVPPAGVGWLRAASAAVLLVLWRRPWRRLRLRYTPLVAAFGTSLCAMNISFYLALARLPLGTAVAIEFLGPVAVAALSSRARRDWASLGLAAIGVALCTDVHLAGSPQGVGFALLAAAFWALYILLGHRVANLGAGVDGLGMGMLAGAVVLAPPTAWQAGPAFSHPALLVAVVGVGLLSSVVPYALDQVAMARVRRGRFALLLALLPATAALAGAALLGQIPKPGEAAGLAAVMAAVATSRRALPL